jgi:hypothetical protein
MSTAPQGQWPQGKWLKGQWLQAQRREADLALAVRGIRIPGLDRALDVIA